jgi:hypothetical protein
LSTRLEPSCAAPQRQRHTRRRFADNKSLKRCLDFVKKRRAIDGLGPWFGLGKFELLALANRAAFFPLAGPELIEDRRTDSEFFRGLYSDPLVSWVA